MSEPTYTITLTESERTAWAKVLGGLVTKLINAPIFVEAPSGGTQSARAVLSPPTSPAAASSPSSVELRDRWARDRKGNEVPMPDGYAAREVNIWKTEQKPPKKANGKPYLKVYVAVSGSRLHRRQLLRPATLPLADQAAGAKDHALPREVGRVLERRGGARLNAIKIILGILIYCLLSSIAATVLCSALHRIRERKDRP